VGCSYDEEDGFLWLGAGKSQGRSALERGHCRGAGTVSVHLEEPYQHLGGYGADMWAVSEKSPTHMEARITKSKRMGVGSLGLLYCSENRCFTTPFIV
jgi:hypothetical protein